jgi:4-hydroxybenzoate polyprenyltransferase
MKPQEIYAELRNRPLPTEHNMRRILWTAIGVVAAAGVVVAWFARGSR